MQRDRTARRWRALLSGMMLVLAGCSSLAVRPVRMPDLLQGWKRSIVAADDLSPRTLQTLRRLDLESTYRRNPGEAQARLHAVAVQDSQPDLVFALAEMSYLVGQKIEQRNCGEAMAYYYLCAGYAFHYLFAERGTVPCQGPDTTGAPGPHGLERFTQASPFDPRFRLACDLYNAGLAKCIRAAQRVGELDARKELHLATADCKGYRLSVVHHGFAWRPEEFGRLLLAEDFEVVGLRNQYGGYGLGVPLIGIRDPNAPAPGQAFYPRKVAFPVTAFFRFEGTLADLGERRAGRLELFNPLTTQVVAVQRQSVPLQTDLTTPLAYFLDNTDLGTGYVTGFLRAEQLQKQAGIYMFEPYQPGKIPVVMVHGLLSSPVTWTPLFNDLRADPVLCERYQFWFYLYPTGNPYLVAAADLRETLTKLRKELDPQGADAALDNMVFVGHSMGGLIARLLTVEGGDAFFRLVSTQPLDTLKAKPETMEEIRRTLYFERKNCIRRVVFIGTPHHGSRLSPAWPARLAVKFVRLPSRLMDAATDLATANPGTLPTTKGKLPTSIDLLAPGAPGLELLASQPRPADVHFHSIIGVLPPGPQLVGAYLAGDGDQRGTDGVVKYTSAHLEDVDSELVVGADHMVIHHHPLTALEVRRILLDHLRGQTSVAKPTRPPSEARFDR